MKELTQKARESWEKSLRDREVWEEGEVVEYHAQGDYWSFMNQSRGNVVFTNQKIVFLGWSTRIFPYCDIRNVEKCNVGGLPIMPTGIKLTVFDPTTGKETKHKLSVMKRKEWIKYIAQKANLPIEV